MAQRGRARAAAERVTACCGSPARRCTPCMRAQYSAVRPGALGKPATQSTARPTAAWPASLQPSPDASTPPTWGLGPGESKSDQSHVAGGTGQEAAACCTCTRGQRQQRGRCLPAGMHRAKTMPCTAWQPAPWQGWARRGCVGPTWEEPSAGCELTRSGGLVPHPTTKLRYAVPSA